MEYLLTSSPPLRFYEIDRLARPCAPSASPGADFLTRAVHLKTSCVLALAKDRFAHTTPEWKPLAVSGKLLILKVPEIGIEPIRGLSPTGF